MFSEYKKNFFKVKKNYNRFLRLFHSPPDTCVKREYETRDIHVWAKIFIASLTV